MEAISKDKRYTYADYLTWDDDVRYELIDGVPYMMSSPSRIHQEILGILHVRLFNFLEGKPCRVFISPLDVRLNANKEKSDNSIVQPDLLVVCDKSKVDVQSINGAPDFVIEVLSPSTASYDFIVKLNKYIQAGVREFWIVDPVTETVQVHIIENNNHIINTYEKHETVPVHILDGCIIDLKDVFTN
ncbi:MAG: Uma2 family endonuclease [Oscillospiraceae bacterium]|nr:Uma2 family endonuclease [Oscillospiraceae bacterium]